jgi:hypothetical protein
MTHKFDFEFLVSGPMNLARLKVDRSAPNVNLAQNAAMKRQQYMATLRHEHYIRHSLRLPTLYNEISL